MKRESKPSDNVLLSATATVNGEPVAVSIEHGLRLLPKAKPRKRRKGWTSTDARCLKLGRDRQARAPKGGA